MFIQSLFIGYVYSGFLRLIAFIFFLAGLCFFYFFFGRSELMALAFVLTLSGAYVFSVRTFLRKKGNCFKLETQTFFFLSSGKWINQSRYPLTSYKTAHKTYEMPRAFAMLNQGSVFVKDHDFRVVLTDEKQRKFLNLYDFGTMDEATKFINKVNSILQTEFALWGSRMKK